MPNEQFQHLVVTLTGFDCFDDYRRYLLQLADDNAASGREATATDYATMAALLMAIKDTCV